MHGGYNKQFKFHARYICLLKIHWMIGVKTGTFPTAHKFISGIDIEK